MAQFKSENGENLESPIDLPRNVNTENLQLILNALLKKDGSNELIPYTFFVNGKEVVNNLEATLQNETLNSEKVLEIIYQPQAIFQVRAVTRCTRYLRFIGNESIGRCSSCLISLILFSSSLLGHSEAVVAVSFSPNGKHLASGSGDTQVRFWDLSTETPLFTCKG